MNDTYSCEIDLDSIGSRKRERVGICIHCGFFIYDDEEAAKLKSNGELLHRSCFEEFAAENKDEFLDNI